MVKKNRNISVIILAGGSSVFSPLTYSEMGHDVHFETEGMGLKHFFNKSGNTYCKDGHRR